ncbi:hypothetical protein TWF281_007908 [Arthrobotrys megalospora]
MRLKALHLLLIGLGLVAQTGSVPVSGDIGGTKQICHHERETEEVSVKLASPAGGLDGFELSSYDTIVIEHATRIGTSTGVSRIQKAEAEAIHHGDVKTEEVIDETTSAKDQNTGRWGPDAFDKDSGSVVTTINSSEKPVAGDRSPTTSQHHELLLHKRDTLDSGSLSTSTSTVSLPVPTEHHIADGNESHVNELYSRVDVPTSFFYESGLMIVCRSTDAVYHAPKRDVLWAGVNWPDFQNEYQDRRTAKVGIKKRQIGCRELCKCDENGKIVLNPDEVVQREGGTQPRGRGNDHACMKKQTYPDGCALVYGCWCTTQLNKTPGSIPGASVLDYQEALDSLPETVKHDNEGFRFDAGGSTGGMTHWITFSEERRMFSNRPARSGLADIARLAELPQRRPAPIRPPELRRNRPQGAPAELPEADGMFINFFNPGPNRNFGDSDGSSRGYYYGTPPPDYKGPGE